MLRTTDSTSMWRAFDPSMRSVYALGVCHDSEDAHLSKVERHQVPRYGLGMSLDRITVDPGRMNGLPCIRDLRVTVAMVLGQLAAGQTRDQILTDYPYLDVHDITAALEFGAARANEG